MSLKRPSLRETGVLSVDGASGATCGWAWRYAGRSWTGLCNPYQELPSLKGLFYPSVVDGMRRAVLLLERPAPYGMKMASRDTLVASYGVWIDAFRRNLPQGVEYFDIKWVMPVEWRKRVYGHASPADGDMLKALAMRVCDCLEIEHGGDDNRAEAGLMGYGELLEPDEKSACIDLVPAVLKSLGAPPKEKKSKRTRKIRRKRAPVPVAL